MKQIITTLFSLFVCIVVIAQDSPTLSQKVTRLMDVINENHIQPKKIDTEFVDFLNSTFLNYLDPDELVFNESDLTLFETLSQSLV